MIDHLSTYATDYAATRRFNVEAVCHAPVAGTVETGT